MNVAVTPSAVALDTTKPVSIAVLAMGGQGGGVLVDWIVGLAEHQGWVAQATSVPGVAQRTGATIYYIEALPQSPRARGARPVLSLMPAPGEVDIVIAAELMEAGRAMQRGLVTRDRTTLIASSHRAYAVAEKLVPGDGSGDAEKVYAAAAVATKRFIAFDMSALADQAGSAISAVLFGALAGAGVLPFPRPAFEATIRGAGVGVEPSLRAFALGYESATKAAADDKAHPPHAPKAPLKRYPSLSPVGHPDYDALLEHARAEFPSAVHDMLAAGLQRVVDFQDTAYGHEYVNLVREILLLDKVSGGDARGFALTRQAAKYIAVAMSYDDVYRVADVKTRPGRLERICTEVAAGADQLVYTTEFMHPRMEEVVGSLPVALALFVERRPRLFRALDRVVNRGRRVRSGTVRWFLVLYVLAGMKRFRRGTLRHAREVAHRDAWLARVKAAAANDYDLAVELLAVRRLIKGYSDTHARGHSKFDTVMRGAAKLEGRPDAAQWVRRLREAALRDEEGTELAGALKTVDSFL